MSKFYVGQRVRIVGCDPGSSAKKLIGSQCRITRPGRNCLGWDMWSVDADGGGFCFLESELEPILDPGREVISWSAMEGLWVPGGVVA
jgi:hypothetical protein